MRDLAGFHAQAQKTNTKVVLIALRRWVSLVTRKHANLQGSRLKIPMLLLSLHSNDFQRLCECGKVKTT